MNKENLRVWWQKPKRYADQEADRKVSFLELFYDLIYVAIIAQLAHKLATDNVTWHSFSEFALLFLAVWWGWFNGAIYHDLHGNDDIKTRVITFVQMFAVAGMAIFIHNAFDDGAVGFAIAYALYLCIITILWYRTGVHDPDHRPLSTPYSIIYALSVTLVVSSIFVAPPFRFWLWAISLVLILILPFTLAVLARKRPKMKAQIEISSGLSPSITERFGLITIIVLGEVVVDIVSGLTSTNHLESMNIFIGFLTMGIAIGIWWLYFDFIARQPQKKVHLTQNVWGYLHMPLTLGITAIGAASLNIVAAGDEADQSIKLLLISGVSFVYFIIFLMTFTLEEREGSKAIRKKGQIVIAMSIIVPLILYHINLKTYVLLICIDITLLMPIYFGLRAWIKQHRK